MNQSEGLQTNTHAESIISNSFDQPVHNFTPSTVIPKPKHASHGLTKRKVKLEFTDDDGGNYTITLDGSISRDRIIKVVDMMELLSGEDDPTPLIGDSTIFGRIYNTIVKTFPLGSFTSGDALEAYEDTHNSTVKLSTVSTYLQRLSDKGLLKRERNGDTWIYRRARPQVSR